MNGKEMFTYKLLSECDVGSVNSFFDKMGGESRAFFNRRNYNRRRAIDFCLGKSPHSRYFGVFLENSIAGIVFLLDSDTGIPELGLALRDDLRGRGLGHELVRFAVNEAKALGVNYTVGNLLSSDVFYNADPKFNDGWYKMGVLGVEMEAAALYMNAAAAGKRALAICTVSDHIIRGEALDSDARQNTFTDMMKIALNIAVEMHNKK